MKQTHGNPKTNTLNAGVTEKDVVAAITKSGYPLQTVISDRLRSSFQIQEEWSYIDRDSKELRTIDILAQCDLGNDKEKQPFVRPGLALLFECKQSTLPYAFFLSRALPWLPDFPGIAGLAKNEISITTDDDRSSWSFRVLHALGLDRHEFVRNVNSCSTLSKCVRKGPELELSGSESYNGLVLPLVKAVQHFEQSKKPSETAVYFDATLTIGIGVLDAPMIGVHVTESGNELISTPWVRVLRHESLEADHPLDRSRLHVLDIVHADYLTTYISDHLMPFATDYSRLALKHQEIIANGTAFVSGMGRDSWGNIEERLQFKPSVARMAQRIIARKSKS